MADNTIPLNTKDLPEMSQTELRFLDAEAGEKQEPRGDATLVPTHQETAPGRRPLFRS
jgi:hypothetical protein